jgi:hypothetical protein
MIFNGLNRQISIFSTALRIRIGIDFCRLDPDPHRECGIGSGARGEKMIPKNRKKEETCFEVLDVLF